MMAGALVDNLPVINLPAWADILIVAGIITGGLWGISITKARSIHALTIFVGVAVLVLAYFVVAHAYMDIGRKHLIAGGFISGTVVLATSLFRRRTPTP